jgi:peptidoglycan hydrolase-like protein with peptidoglycan-binding domain
MKKLTVLVLAFAWTAVLHADDQLRQVQQALKEGGFYYGEVDGEEGSETNAAVRRYQIRNGLEVTGKLNAETLATLHIGRPAPEAPAITSQAPIRSAPESEPKAPPPARNLTESDRNFLQRQPAPAAPEPIDTPPPPPQVAPPNVPLFAHTPYEQAPLTVQRDALRRAQDRLAADGFYRGPIDGNAGPETVRALLRYQRDADLPETGRLDMATLADMNLLPGRRMIFLNRPAEDFDELPIRRQRVYRGIWVR